MIIIDSDCLNVWLFNSGWIQCYMKYYYEIYSKWEFLPSKLLGSPGNSVNGFPCGSAGKESACSG